MYHVSAQGVDERMINVHFYIINIIIIISGMVRRPARPTILSDINYRECTNILIYHPALFYVIRLD